MFLRKLGIGLNVTFNATVVVHCRRVVVSARYYKDLGKGIGMDRERNLVS